jgi:hypothetical protein
MVRIAIAWLLKDPGVVVSAIENPIDFPMSVGGALGVLAFTRAFFGADANKEGRGIAKRKTRPAEPRVQSDLFATLFRCADHQRILSAIELHGTLKR